MALSGGKNSPGDGHKSGGGPAPAGIGSKPVNSCSRCGAMYTGNSHTCH
jgi:hypothetical protein